jgi:hypothetical protein
MFEKLRICAGGIYSSLNKRVLPECESGVRGGFYIPIHFYIMPGEYFFPALKRPSALE